jgi:LmbE family N-acetylglucosaminyl deacetylase
MIQRTSGGSASRTASCGEASVKWPRIVPAPLEVRRMAEAIERVMVITAHPDDSEFGAGGTVARMVKEGREVTYVIATNGNKGSGDRTMMPERLAAIRTEEQRNAARTLGVARVEFLGYPDGELEDTRDLRLDVTRQIRRWRPDLVITMNPHRTYNLYASHRDHRIVAGVALDCVYPLARDHMSFPELMPELEPHKVREIYLMQWDNPHIVVDITEVVDLKLKALACHVSQVGDFAGVETRVRERLAEIGREKGYAYAEAFDRIVMPR